MLSARETALRALISFRREGAWPDLYLKKACADMRSEEAALASTITYGVLQNRLIWIFCWASFLPVLWKKSPHRCWMLCVWVPISWYF